MSSVDVSLLLSKLIDTGMTPMSISDGLGGRVSYRTIYRWVKKESVPQNSTDVQALVEFAQGRGITCDGNNE